MYHFYFDESFHDRKIVINEEEINTLSDENDSDSYIGFFWGAEETIAEKVIRRFVELENRYKQKLGITDEMKATTFAKKNYRYGVNTFNRDCAAFYKEFFDILDTPGVVFHYTVVSKIEYTLYRLFGNCIDDLNAFFKLYGISFPLFIYSLTKFIITYYNKELVSSLYAVTDAETSTIFKNKLVEQLETICKAIKGIKRKERELLAFRQLIFILDTFDFSVAEEKSFSFTYIHNFEGLSALLRELDINTNQVQLFIDNEEKTVATAEMYEFASVASVDSKASAGVRIADFLSNFVGRFIYAQRHDPSRSEDKITSIADIARNDLSSKRLLNDKWFELSRDQYELYIKIAQTLIMNHQQYWTVLTLNYCDDAVCFAELFKYFYYTETYEKYISTNKMLRKEYYNSLVCTVLEERYAKMWEDS